MFIRFRRSIALYGPSTMMVLTSGHGVNGFTLDREVGEFILTHPNMSIPEDTREFAINSWNARFWEVPVQRYVDECLAGTKGPRGGELQYALGGLVKPHSCCKLWSGIPV